jgi:hypothetical protein
MTFAEYLLDHIRLPRLQERRVLVVFDPQKRYLEIKLFSGKQATEQLRGIFFCSRIPHPDADLVAASDGGSRWSESAGETVWLFTDLEGKEIATGSKVIADQLRCLPDTSPVHAFDRADLSKLREKVEKRLKNNKLKPLQAPVGVSPILKCWMEVV